MQNRVAMCPIIALSNVACSRCRTSYVRSRHVFYFCVVKCLIGPLLDVLESLRRNMHIFNLDSNDPYCIIRSTPLLYKCCNLYSNAQKRFYKLLRI